MRNIHRQGKSLLILMLAGAIVFALTACEPAAEKTALKFNVTLSEKAFQGIEDLGLEVPVKGRVFVIVSKDKGASKAELLQYYTSGDIIRDYKSVVGYASFRII
jgi:hypothetical protein